MTVSDRDQSIIDKTRNTSEPTIVFRAQDRHSVGVLTDYSHRLQSDVNVEPEFHRLVQEAIDSFATWQRLNPEKIKTPDLSAAEKAELLERWEWEKADSAVSEEEVE